MASSIVESPIARGGRPCSGRFLARMYWTPPQPASALAAGRASRVVASSAASHTYRVERLTRRPGLPAGAEFTRGALPSIHALPHRPVRDLLPARARDLVAPDAAADLLEAVHPRR